MKLSCDPLSNESNNYYFARQESDEQEKLLRLEKLMTVCQVTVCQVSQVIWTTVLVDSVSSESGGCAMEQCHVSQVTVPRNSVSCESGDCAIEQCVM